MEEVAKMIYNFLVVLYYWVESIFLFLIPRCLKYKDISGDIVLVTGAGSGIGRLMALKFSRRGATLVLWDINEEANAETARLVDEEGGKVLKYTLDVTNREEVYATAARVRNDIGCVDILVNNAGIVVGKNILQLDDKMIEKVFSVNVLAHFWLTKAFLGDMIRRKQGHLVTIASLAGLGGMPKLTDYCASKFAAVGLMESLFVELHAEGHKNIHTTTVCPYFINTGMFNGAGAKLFNMLDPEYVADEVVSAVLCNHHLVMIPRAFYALNILKSMIPAKSLLALQDACGGSDSMVSFTGRQQTQNGTARIEKRD